MRLVVSLGIGACVALSTAVIVSALGRVGAPANAAVWAPVGSTRYKKYDPGTRVTV